MKFGLKINTEFPIKKKTPFMTTLYDHLMFFRGFLIKKTNHAFLMREHIPMNITTKLGSNWPSGFGED
jgi:hypothetical protein